MLSNTDRKASNGRGHGVQIGHVLSGSGFPEKDVRAVTYMFHSKVAEKGGNISALVLGEHFHKLETNSGSGEPLTIFQLQKQCWESVRSKSKPELLACIGYECEKAK